MDFRSSGPRCQSSTPYSCQAIHWNSGVPSHCVVYGQRQDAHELPRTSTRSATDLDEDVSPCLSHAD